MNIVLITSDTVPKFRQVYTVYMSHALGPFQSSFGVIS